ncbi:Alpha-(1,3)-fucosyltransferase C [Aphelenchoides fujianensis]|nr:Alpha-(1,3)-fucosyltransferase C [Aphelenchoides fujianensis]
MGGFLKAANTPLMASSASSARELTAFTVFSTIKTTTLADRLTPEEEPVQPLGRRPLIVLWDPYLTVYFDRFASDNTSVVLPCPYECEYSLDRKRGEEADIRLFHQRILDPDHLPPPRADGRFLNVAMNPEPPYMKHPHVMRVHKLGVPLNFFNATATYRSTSEVYYPYNLFVPRDGSESEKEVWTEEQIEEKLGAKRKVSLIAMSNCDAQSKRHEYVSALAAHIEVTRVGRCNGTFECPKNRDLKGRLKKTNCMKELIDSHFFYLAFENSVCPEYVTEKFWRVKELIVPVVLSRAVMPPHIPADTFIAASDFATPAALAAHLRWLIAHPQEYRKYFNWTKRYRRSSLSRAEVNGSCQLCKLAHRQIEHLVPEYEGLRECIRDYALNLLTNTPDEINNVHDHEKRMGELMARTYRPRSLGRIL